MPTDVSGTINIIAEVVGNSSSPVTGTGNSSLGKPKKEKGILALLKDVSKSASKMAAILGIGGLLASSKIISGTMGSIMRIFGTFMDVIIGPIAPLLVRGLVILATVVMWIRKLITGESAWSDAWAGLKQWWIDTWNEKGGLWGIFTEGLKNITGVALIAALFASIVATPMAGVWVMKQFFGVGKFLTKSLLKGALGLAKFLIKAPFKLVKFAATVVSQGFTFAKYAAKGLFNIIPQFAAYAGRALWNMLPAVVQRPLLAASALLGKMFTKAAIFTKSILHGLVGFAKWGVSAAKVVAGWAWSTIMFGAGGIKTAAKWTTLKILGYLGLTQLFTTAGAYLLGVGAAMLPALLGILIVGGAITAVILAKMLIEAAYGKSIKDIGDTMDYASQNPDWAAENNVYVPPDKTNSGIMGWLSMLAEAVSSQATGGIPGYTDTNVSFATGGATDAAVPADPAVGE